MDSNPKAQVIERLREAQNILITVSINPSVDQLSAAIGFALLLNKLNKRATAVFSGKIPSTLEFLQPEETLESTTDSLRDFIISLDKSKADKLRYKVEADVVRIFITPFKTHLSDKDLIFEQGDFNVEVVVALGVDQREHIDAAIMAHGRILHDATVIGIMAGATPIDVGGINWQEPNASSLCEMIVGIGDSFQKDFLDTQIATAFLTGIVAETDRFSNSKTSPKVMTVSAQLMAAGANQQLIATKLVEEPEEPEPTDEEYVFDESPSVPEVQAETPEISLPPVVPPTPPAPNNNEGTITLHDAPIAAEVLDSVDEQEDDQDQEMPILSKPAPAYEEPSDSKSQIDKIHIDKQGTLHSAENSTQAVSDLPPANRDSQYGGKVVQPLPDSSTQNTYQAPNKGNSYIAQPPTIGGTLTASGIDESTQETLEQTTDPLSVPPGGVFPEQNAVTSAKFSLPNSQTGNPSSSGRSFATEPLTSDSLSDVLSSSTDNQSDGMAAKQDAARKAVLDASNGAFDPNRPGALAATGAEFVPLGSEPEPMSYTNPSGVEDDDDEDEPPAVPPPFPMPPANSAN